MLLKRCPIVYALHRVEKLMRTFLLKILIHAVTLVVMGRSLSDVACIFCVTFYTAYYLSLIHI